MDFDPYRIILKAGDLQDILNLLVFFAGRYFLLRGGKEISFLMWEQISFHINKKGIDVGKRYVQLVIHSDKVNYLSLRNHTVDENKCLQKY